ncbi:solute:sodium symporter family transporter, partial [Vibrio anguillarum]|nr:solute:sodium symporter family transporter [Vibrio anguillarum]
LFNFVFQVDIHFFHLVGLLFVANIAFMLTVGYFYPQENHEDVYTEQVDITPWSMTPAVAVLITLSSVSMYVFLAHNVPTWVMSGYYLLAVGALGYVFWVIFRELIRSPRAKMLKAQKDAQ